MIAQRNEMQNQSGKLMNDPSTSNAKKNLRPIADKFLAAGIIGILLAANLSFLSETVRSVIHWISVSIIVVYVIMISKPVMDEYKRIRKLEGARRTNKKRKGFPTALYIISIAVAALGLSFIFLVPQGYQSYLVQTKASDWPHTMGEVLSAEIIVDEGELGVSDDMVQPRVITQYNVNGRTYAIHEISFNQSMSWSSSDRYAKTMINQYPPGTRVPVYYNPEQPSQAVLDTSADWFTFFIMGLGAIFVLLGVYWFWLSLRDTWLFIANLLNKSRN